MCATQSGCSAQVASTCGAVQYLTSRITNLCLPFFAQLSGLHVPRIRLVSRHHESCRSKVLSLPCMHGYILTVLPSVFFAMYDSFSTVSNVNQDAF
jgi:hypothetical protein